MVFTPPSWSPKLPFDPPDNVTIGEFMYSERFRHRSLAASRNPFTCGLTGKTFTATQAKDRVDFIARALGKRAGWTPQEGTEWDKVACIFSFNTIDYISTIHAVHRLNGIVSPASASYNAAELHHLLVATNSTVIFTSGRLVQTALEAADKANIPRDRVFILETPENGADAKAFVSVPDLVEEGRRLPQLPLLKWVPGQGERQCALICFSSGTSGLPKGVMISHRNVIANVMQAACHESYGRKKSGVVTQTSLGLLPFSHIYGLVVITHLASYHGDEVVVLPKYDLKQMLGAIEKQSINCLYLVPPIIVQMLQHKAVCAKYNLSSVRLIFSGAAPLGAEAVDEVKSIWPKWNICQGYGLTESSTGISLTSEHDILPGTSGSLLPDVRCKIMDPEGNEITTYETLGELLVQSPSIVLGYLNNAKSTAETFVWDKDGRWLRTGDEVLIRKSPAGNEHLVIVDRIKELIKVKGHQVAPAELEAHLLSHEYVSDCAVIQLPDKYAGEIPKAYVVKSPAAGSKPDAEVAETISKFVEDHKARYKWLAGGVEFIDAIPKSPAGKILRRLLRDNEVQRRKKSNPKL